MLRIRTARLELVAAEAPLASAEAEALQGWCAPLGVNPPPTWPPAPNGSETLRWFASAVARDPEGIGWYTWHVVQCTPRALAGHSGFKGRPDAHGSVEIGYSLLPAFQGLGYGTELVRALAGWAFEHPIVARVMAVTYPELLASVRVLEKNGFTLAGRAEQPGAVRYELRRAVFHLRQMS